MQLIMLDHMPRASQVDSCRYKISHLICHHNHSSSRPFRNINYYSSKDNSNNSNNSSHLTIVGIRARS